MPSLPIYRIATTQVKSKTKTMAAVAMAKTVQAVRPHIPLIKFPPRGSLTAKPVSATSSGNVEQLLSSSAPAPVTAKPSSSGSKGPAIESSELPSRYRRKPLSDEEMEYIEKGGQV